MAPLTAPDALAVATQWLAWLEDCLARLLSCLALDKFADYVDDSVTAPVRETAAQAGGYAGAAVGPARQGRLLHLIKHLEEPDDWKVGGKGCCVRCRRDRGVAYGRLYRSGTEAARVQEWKKPLREALIFEGRFLGIIGPLVLRHDRGLASMRAPCMHGKCRCQQLCALTLHPECQECS